MKFLDIRNAVKKNKKKDKGVNSTANTPYDEGFIVVMTYFTYLVG